MNKTMYIRYKIKSEYYIFIEIIIIINIKRYQKLIKTFYLWYENILYFHSYTNMYNIQIYK